MAESKPRFEINEIHSWSMQWFKTNPYHIYDNQEGCWVCDTTEGNGNDFLGYKTEEEANSRIEHLNSIGDRVKRIELLNLSKNPQIQQVRSYPKIPGKVELCQPLLS